jgi:hypothetical protein
MGKTTINIIFRLNILSVLILFFLSGCATTTKVSQGWQKRGTKGALDDVLVFNDLQQVDLDKDGQKEIVAIYTTNKPRHASGVKVVKFHNDKGEIIFERIYDSSNIEFVMKDNIPIIIVEKTVESAGCTTGKIRSYYQWNGKAFAFLQ